MNVNDRERLLCYAAGILGSTLANPNHTSGVTDWLIKRSIRQASELIDSIFDDGKLTEILRNENHDGSPANASNVRVRNTNK